MKKLNKIRIVSLTNNEAGQLVKRNLNDFQAAGIDLQTDIHLQNFITQMRADTTLLDKTLIQNHKKGEAEALEQLDRVRDLAFIALTRQFKVYELSDIAAEVSAYRSLKTLFINYKALQNLNYEAETNAINHMLQELESNQYSEDVSTLNLGNYIKRLRIANAEFDTRFSQRSTDTATNTSYDIKIIRRTMLQNYSLFANYIVSLANSTDTTTYHNILDIINTNRRYYSDMISRRQGGNKVPAVDVNAN